MKKASYLLYPLLGLAGAMAVPKDHNCDPAPGAPCFTYDDPICTFCLGPEVVNPSVGPITCNGDWSFEVSGLYWKTHQDGMEYAVTTDVSASDPVALSSQINNLINGKYKSPDFKGNFGIRLGVGYTSTHDGWDLSLVWTNYNGRASSHIEAEIEDNFVIVPLWSAYVAPDVENLIATDIVTKWKMSLNLFDFDLGRDFWTSKYLSLHPFIGLRYASIDQRFRLQHKGDSWRSFDVVPPLNNFVQMKNDFWGIGPRAGFDATWHLARGFSLFNHVAIDLLYGRFHVKNDEYNKAATPSFARRTVLETNESFRASRAVVDLSLGLQWQTLFSDCRYQFTASLAWEQHLFLSQNQLWRVKRVGENIEGDVQGENVYHHRRGDLDTEGLVLTARFSF